MVRKQNKNILSKKEFTLRLLNYALFSILLLLISLLIGVLGYHFLAKLSWLDSFYNSSMILTGMGPIDKMTSSSSKIFASIYAIYSGVIFLSSVALFFAPIAHRLMHLLKIEQD